MRFGFIESEKANHRVRMMCRVLQVSPSGYYAFVHRSPSHGEQGDAKLKLCVQTVHTTSRGTYGRELAQKALSANDG
jgi:putative transposase